jgi:hypothetical protein
MKKLYFLLLLAFLLFTLVAVAQNTSNSSSGPGSTVDSQSNSNLQNSTSSGHSGNMGTQSSPNAANSNSQSSGVNGNIVEGCVVQVEKDYYLQPLNGGNRLRLRGSHEFSADVGHAVRAEGTAGPPGVPMGSNETPDNSANNNPDRPPVSSSSTGGNTQDFVVTRVTTVSQTCPANTGNSPSGSMNNPH